MLSRASQTTRGYSKSRIREISETRVPDSYKADIILDNSDKSLVSLDFENYQSVLSEGFATGVSRTAWVANTAYALDDIRIPTTANGYQYRCAVAGTSHATTEPTWPTDLGVRVTDGTVTWEMDGNSGDEYSYDPPMKVRVQELHSGRGILRCILRTIGIPDQLKEDKAIAKYTQESTDTNTVKTLISAVCAAGTGLSSAYNGYTAITVVYDSEDSLIDTFMPKEYFSVSLNESRWDKIEELLDYTGCKWRFENDGKLHIFVPKKATSIYEYLNTEDDTSIGLFDNTQLGGQTFTPSISHTIISVKLLLYRAGLPGTLTVSIRNTSGGYPTGSNLCYGTTNGNTLPLSLPGEWREITFNNGINLIAGTQYAIVIRTSNPIFGNVLALRADETSPPYTGGLYLESLDSDVTWIIYPANSDLMFEEWGIIYDYEYKFNVAGDHTFFNKAVRLRFVNPNIVIVASHPDHTPQYTGSATSATSYALDPKTQTIYRRLASNAQAAAIAAAMIERYELDDERGFATVPMNVGQELWDYVKITDSRQGDTRIGNIQYLSESVKIPEGNEGLTFNMMLAFGKVNLLSMMSNMLSSGIDVARLTNEQILAMYDAIIDYLEKNAIETVWLKESVPDNLDDLVDGIAYKRTKSAAISPTGLVLLDQVVIGTLKDLIDKTYISAGKLYLSSVIQEAGYRTVNDSEKVVWDGKTKTFRQATAPISGMVAGDLWIDTDDGDKPYTYSGAAWIASYTIISGGYIKTGIIDASLVTIQSISGANKIIIDANYIAGYAGAVRQFYISAADGKAYAGAGAVILDSAGITTKADSAWRIFNDAVQYGVLYVAANTFGFLGASNIGFYIQTQGIGAILIATSGADIILDPAGGWVDVNGGIDLNFGTYGADIYKCGDITTKVDSVNFIGEAATKFHTVYADNFTACPMPTVPSALDLLKSIKAPAVIKDGRYGERHYFKDADFPDEMKVETYDKDKDSRKMVKTGRKEVEIIRTVGVLVQATRELIKKVEALEAR